MLSMAECVTSNEYSIIIGFFIEEFNWNADLSMIKSVELIDAEEHSFIR